MQTTKLALVAVLIVVGIIVLIAGGIVVALDRRKTTTTISGTSNNTPTGLTINTLIPSIVKTVRVGDIDIAYRIFGKGNPFLLIPGSS